MTATLARIMGMMLFLAACAAHAHGACANFITRNGGRLMDGDKPFRFMGVEAFDTH